jgi:hypothetical protein
MRRAEERDISVAFVPRFFEHVPQRITVQHLGGLSLLVPQVVRPRDWHFRVKYVVDWIAAAALLVLTLPVFLLAAAAVRLTMGRPRRVRKPDHAARWYSWISPPRRSCRRMGGVSEV